MGCTSSKQNTGAAAEAPNAARTNTLLQHPHAQEQKAPYSAAAAEVADASAKVPETAAAEETVAPAQQEKVTKVTSEVVTVSYTPEEEETDAQPTGASRTKGRKATPWLGAKAGHAVDFEDDEDDDEDGGDEDQKAAEPIKRKAIRKATPWTKPAAPMDDDEDSDYEDLETYAPDSAPAQASAALAPAPDAWLCGFCMGPCITKESEQELSYGLPQEA
eukprot:gb/GFBE01020348.1/.p1 GENE.gb/GFBE01020348.1/~~gb/GFBE01020348.1/.p1  ORF type:complete len:218 (+),score=64.79 gb/GFBE01020348.1/:1-654(+)